jgi:hypothetical protein
MFNCTVLVLEVQKTKEQGIKQGRGFDYQVLNGTTTLGSNWCGTKGLYVLYC